jgi:hypothetical protein
MQFLALNPCRGLSRFRELHHPQSATPFLHCPAMLRENYCGIAEQESQVYSYWGQILARKSR